MDAICRPVFARLARSRDQAPASGGYSRPVPHSHRILFIGGLHRSGTTPLAQWIAQHPEVSALHGTGVYMDEGQHLQDLYPTAAAHGGPGRFAFDAGAHLTETSPLVSADARARLWAAWSPYWDLAKPVLVEKSPPNLLRTRFLQAVFPGAYFLVIMRHPIAVAYATKRWSKRHRRVPAALARRLSLAQAPAGALIRHWITAHERLLADAPHVEHLRIVRYEDLVADPEGTLQSVFEFLGLDARPVHVTPRRGINEAYLRRWGESRQGAVGRLKAKRVVRRLNPRVRRFGYDLAAPELKAEAAPEVAGYLIRAAAT